MGYLVRKMKNSTRMPVSMPDVLKSRLEQYAEKHGCSQAEVIRYALLRLMEGKK